MVMIKKLYLIEADKIKNVIGVKIKANNGNFNKKNNLTLKIIEKIKINKIITIIELFL